MNPKQAAIAVAAGLAACAGTGTGFAETIQVSIEKLAFVPANVSAHVGDTIEWQNKDFLAHTATARDKAWDVTLPVNGSGRVVLKAAGSIEYYCRFHPNMVGRISVAAKGQ